MILIMAKIGEKSWGAGGGGFGLAQEAASVGRTARTWPVLVLGAAIVAAGVYDDSVAGIVIGAGVIVIGLWWLIIRLRSARDAIRLERRARASADADDHQ